MGERGRPFRRRRSYLSQKLDRPLPIKGGPTLHTIGEARDYMTSMGKRRELLSHWQRVAKLILAKEDVLTVSRALEPALFYDAKLDVLKAPAKLKAPVTLLGVGDRHFCNGPIDPKAGFS
jgi:hypothetical protein